MKKILLIIPALLIFTGCSTSTPASVNTQQSPSPAADVTASPTTASTNGEYTMADVQQHSSASDCRMVIDKNVYNVTSFIPNHPGGEEIVKGCGRDATAMFSRQDQHSGADAQAVLPTLKIGVIK